MSRAKRLRLAGAAGETELHAVRLEPFAEGYRMERGTTVVRSADSPIWSVVTEAGLSFEACVEATDTEVEVVIGSSRFRFELGAAPVTAARKGGASGRIEVKSPMPGRVVKILVEPGQRVAGGEPVLLFEAMKMQNELRSPETGVVSEIAVSAGQAVEARERLYVLSSS